MRFGPVPVDEAAGSILGHNVVDGQGRRRLRKGSELTTEDVATLHALGHGEVWVARLEPGDIDEDESAARIARALLGERDPAELGLSWSGPRTGRVNLRCVRRGVLEVRPGPVHRVNRHRGITFATSSPGAVVDAGRTVATVKILPYALPEAAVTAAAGEALDEERRPCVRVHPLRPRSCALVLFGHRAGEDRALGTFETAMRRRLVELGSSLDDVRLVDTAGAESGEVAALATALETVAATADLVLVAGATAIQDEHDIAPAAVERAGGEVLCFGAPVDPGNLLLLGELRGRALLGVPGCARSPKRNIVDLVLPRLLVDRRWSADEIMDMGVGGLLDDVPERPLPRHRI